MKRIQSPPLRGGCTHPGLWPPLRGEDRNSLLPLGKDPLLGGMAEGRGGTSLEPVDARSEMSLVNGLQNKMRNGRTLMHATKFIALLLIVCFLSCPATVIATTEQGRQRNLIGDLLAPLQKLVSHDTTPER